MNQNPQTQYQPTHSAPKPTVINKTLRSFGLTLLLLQIALIIIYGFFVRVETKSPPDPLQSQRYPAFRDISLMMLLGFGLLTTFIRTHAWSALVYTFLINSIVAQLYILLNSFWQRLLQGFNNTDTSIYLQQITLTKSSYACAAVLVSYGAVLGRIGPRELLIMAVVQTVGYTLNQVLFYDYLHCFDDGGSMTIHCFGAYFGLTVSLILSNKVPPTNQPQANYLSNIFAMAGTLFLWLFWPSFNFGVDAETFFEQNQIVVNTVLSLTGSCLATFVMSSLFRRGLEMQDLLNATLAGGVAIGACCGLLYQPGVAMAVGFAAGVISTLAFMFLSPKLENKIGLYDSCGVHNLHGIPGIFGGVVSAIIVAFYQTGYDHTVAANYGSNSIFNLAPNRYLHQGGLQIAGIFLSIGMAILFAILASLIIRKLYNEHPRTFYRDTKYFDHADTETTVWGHLDQPRQNIAVMTSIRLQEAGESKYPKKSNEHLPIIISSNRIHSEQRLNTNPQ